MKPILLTIALFFSTPILTGCAGVSFFEEIIKTENPKYVAITETVYFKGVLPITPEQRFVLIETKSGKKFVAGLVNQIGHVSNWGLGDDMCLNASHLALSGIGGNEYHYYNGRNVRKKL